MHLLAKCLQNAWKGNGQLGERRSPNEEGVIGVHNELEGERERGRQCKQWLDMQTKGTFAHKTPTHKARLLCLYGANTTKSGSRSVFCCFWFSCMCVCVWGNPKKCMHWWSFDRHLKTFSFFPNLLLLQQHPLKQGHRYLGRRSGAFGWQSA